MLALKILLIMLEMQGELFMRGEISRTTNLLQIELRLAKKKH